MDRNEILRLALIGLRKEAELVQQKIREIEAELRGKSTHEQVVSRTHTVSAEGRKRIAAAQKKRWEAHRAAKKVA